MATLNIWLGGLVERQGREELDLAGRRHMVLSESRLDRTVATLDELAARGIDSCRIAHVDALRQTTFGTTPVKELSIVAPDGRTLCTDVGNQPEQRKVISSEPPRRERDNPIDEIERAMKAGEFVPYFHPIVDIRSGRLRGAEVLIRWCKSDGTVVPPATFIPLAESSGLIIEMTRELMRRVCRDAGAVLGARPHLKIGFNLTARHFANEEIVDDVRKIFKHSLLKLTQIVLEITERQPIENLTETRRVIAALQGLGVKVAIDDVGTGHSGLSYMLKLGVDIIKIDKLFIDSVGTDRHSNTIIETLIDLAQNMRMDVIAEGVESFEQVLQLRDLGIRAAQGFVFSPPLPCSAFLQLVETIDPLKAGVLAADQPTVMLAALARHDAA